MPNWCDNTLEVSHKDPAMMKRFKDAFQRGQLCNEFIPNPTGEWDWDFSVNNWGTKWDVGGDDGYIDGDDTLLTCSFQSAWSPPINLYPVLEELGYTVKAMYYEPGCNFAGIYEDGNDDCYELPDTADEIDAELPSELNEAFCIAENRREWEETED